MTLFVTLTLINSLAVAYLKYVQNDQWQGIETIAWYVELHHPTENNNVAYMGGDCVSTH